MLSGLWGGCRFRLRRPFPVPSELKSSSRLESKNQKTMNLDKSREVFCVQGFEILETLIRGFSRGADMRTSGLALLRLMRITETLKRPVESPQRVNNWRPRPLTHRLSFLMSKARAGRTRLADIRLESLMGTTVQCEMVKVKDTWSSASKKIYRLKGNGHPRGGSTPPVPAKLLYKTVAFPVLWCFHAHRGSKGYMNLSTEQPDLGRGEHPRDSIAVSITPIGRWKSLSEFSGKGSSVHTSSLWKMLL